MRARGMTHEAYATIADHGITVQQYADHLGVFFDEKHENMWRGSNCGCPDDRCIGSHHEVHEDCGCVVVLAAEAAEALGVSR